MQAPEVCTYQDPATYSIGVFDANGDEILVTDARSVANASEVMEVIEARLVRGNSYSVELTIQHHDVPGEAFITFIGIDYFDTPMSTTSTMLSSTTSKAVELV
jgi:hypothetical protein